MLTRRSFLTHLTTGALVSILSAPASASDDEDDRRSGVLIVGDSHVRMLGPALRDALEDAGLSVRGYVTRPGWSTSRFLREGELTRVLEGAGHPSLLVICLGGNDVIGSASDYEAQLRALVDEARTAGVERIVWFGPATANARVDPRAAPVAARHEQNAEWQRASLPALGVRWIDSRPLTRRHHARDGVHFLRNGYLRWARGALAAVVEAAGG